MQSWEQRSRAFELKALCPEEGQRHGEGGPRKGKVSEGVGMGGLSAVRGAGRSLRQRRERTGRPGPAES